VGIAAGNIIEENHYYAYGLKIAGISSKKLGDAGEGNLKNNYLYNDKELFDDGDLNWYDYGFRNYDPQIGRFVQLDPLADDYPFLTPYQFAGNDPVANVDLDGLEPANVVGFMKDLGEGVGASARLVETGAAAGRWSVTWFKNGVAYAKIFSAVHVASSTLEIANLTFKSIVIINRVTTSSVGENYRWKIYLQTVAARGAADALANANTVGLYDLFGGNHTESYNTIDEKESYLRGRIVGDAIGAGQGVSEVEGGSGLALATGWTGVGALTGVGVALHGAGVGAVATSDAAWTMAKLIKMGAFLKATSNSPSASNSNNSPSTNGGENLKYAPSKKHQKGGWGTEMDLDDATASKVLNNSIQGGKQRYGWFNGKLYEFQPDNQGGWHGYPIKGTEAPISVLKQLLQRKDINNAQYNKLIKGK